MSTRKKKNKALLLALMVALILIGAATFFLIGVQVSKVVKHELARLEHRSTVRQGFSGDRFSFENVAGRQLNPNDIEVVADDIPGIHSLGAFDGSLYVSSWGRQAIYKVNLANGHKRQLSDELDGVRDMVMDDGKIVTPVFGQGRVVKVDKDSGRVTILARDLAGPNGIAKARDGSFYVSTATSGTVVKISPDGTDVKTIATGLKEPAGIISDTDNILYVAQYADPVNSVIQIFDNGQVRPLVSGLTGAEGLLRDDRRNLMIGHTADGKAALSFYKRGGTTAQPLLTTTLPGPMIGPVTDERYLYFASAGGSTVYRIPLP